MGWESQLAGYAETRWFDAVKTPLESKISPIFHSHLAIPLHSHLLNVKVDLDIGNANSLETLDSVAGVLEKPEKGEGFPTKYFLKGYVDTEGPQSTFVTNARKPRIIRVVDRDSPGPAYDSPPGYALLPGEAMVNTLPDSHPLVKFSAYSKYTVAVTRYHDSEVRVSSPFDNYVPSRPYVSLDNFLNGESLNQTDLVAWVTVPHEHLPRTEDVPLISNYPVGFRLLPWNFFDGNAGMDLPIE